MKWWKFSRGHRFLLKFGGISSLPQQCCNWITVKIQNSLLSWTVKTQIMNANNYPRWICHFQWINGDPNKSQFMPWFPWQSGWLFARCVRDFGFVHSLNLVTRTVVMVLPLPYQTGVYFMQNGVRAPSFVVTAVWRDGYLITVHPGVPLHWTDSNRPPGPFWAHQVPVFGSLFGFPAPDLLLD